MDERTPLLSNHQTPDDCRRVSVRDEHSGTVRPEGDSDHPYQLCVDDISYSVREMARKWYKGGCCYKRTKTILQNVSVTFQRGQLTAVLGNSGSGKTTLLDIIAKRVTEGRILGSIHLKGRILTTGHVKRLIAYVMQDDRLLQTLTVRETLMYTAQLKFAFDFHSKTKHLKERVEKVINEMGLRAVADSRVGGMVHKTLSGGERRRVSIALQLLQDPAVLLLDEPTTGLDSFTAHRIVQTLGSLAKSGKIVILTVHQPRSDIFHLLEQVIMLSQGKVAYAGPRSEIVEYFGERGYPCPQYCNPLDHCMDMIGIDRRKGVWESESEARVEHLLQQFLQSSQHEQTLQTIQKVKDTPLTIPAPRSRSCLANVVGCISTLFILYRRFMLATVRDRAAVMLRTVQLALFSGLLLMFMGRLNDDQRGIQDRTGVLFQSIGVPTFLGMLNAISLFPPLRDMFYREARDGLYPSPMFAISFVALPIPFSIFCTGSFSAIIYWGAGLHADWIRFALYCYVVWCTYMVGELLGLCTMGFIYNTQVANSMISMLVTIAALVATGLLRSIESLPKFFGYLTWVMLPKYASELLVTNEYEGLTFKCSNQTGPCQYPTGESYLSDWFPDGINNKRRNMMAVGFYVLACAVLCVLVFTFKKKNLR